MQIFDSFTAVRLSIHVGRRTRAALNHVRRKLIEKFTGNDAVTRQDDRPGHPGIQHAEIAIGHRRRFFHITKRLNEKRLQRNRQAGDLEILDAAQGLHAVINGIGNLSFTEKILLDPIAHDIPLVVQNLGEELLRPLGAWVGKERFLAVVFHNLALIHEDHPICHALGKAHLVRHAHHGHPLLRQFGHHIDQMIQC